jgi:hypothetical protein
MGSINQTSRRTHQRDLSKPTSPIRGSFSNILRRDTRGRSSTKQISRTQRSSAKEPVNDIRQARRPPHTINRTRTFYGAWPFPVPQKVPSRPTPQSIRQPFPISESRKITATISTNNRRTRGTSNPGSMLRVRHARTYVKRLRNQKAILPRLDPKNPVPNA